MAEGLHERVAWRWSNAAAGAACAFPAAIVAVDDPVRGLALGIGVLPAAALGVRGPRRERSLSLVVGLVAGSALFLGSCVSRSPVLAVVTVFVLCVVVATTSTRYRLGPLVLALGLPVVGAGLSLSGPQEGLGIGALMVVGAAYAWVVSLCWPEGPAGASGAARPQPTSTYLLDYGVRLGLAGASAAALGYVAGIDHPGWACCAALIVSRPSSALTRLRGTGRSVSVLLGATAAIAVEGIDPRPALWGVLVVLVLAGTAGTSGSRWYVTAGFSTFLVISMLVLANPGTTDGWWFLERVVATLVGVALSLLFLVVLPRTGRGSDAAAT